MLKHTPKPWKAHRPGSLSPMEPEWTVTGNASPDPVTEARYLFVAKVLRTAHPDPMWRQDEESEANARLIEAAPDLLDLVRRLVHPMADDDDVGEARSLLARLDTSDPHRV